MCIEHSPGLITGYIIKQFLTNKKVEIIPGIFSDHNEVKLETNSRRKIGRFKLKQHILNNQWVKEDIKLENILSQV